MKTKNSCLLSAALMLTAGILPAPAQSQPRASVSPVPAPAIQPSPALPARAATAVNPVQPGGVLLSQLAAAETGAGDSYGGGFGGGSGFGGTGGSAMGGYGAVSVYRTSSGRESIPPVLIQFTAPDPASAQQLEDDLTIMNHLLDQALDRGLGEDAPPSRLGVPLLYTSSGRSTRAVYLEGYGPVFMIKVNLPLMGPPLPAEDKTSRPAADSEWESAKRELFGPAVDPMIGMPVAAVAPFDAEQVEALKQALIAALKNAANIRGLKDDEHVSIAVFGQPVPPPLPAENTELRDSSDQPESPAPKSSATSRGARSSRKPASRSTATIVKADSYMATGVVQKGTVLTLRARCSDIRAAARGEIAADEFAKRVTTAVYAGSGHGMTSFNSWIQSGSRR